MDYTPFPLRLDDKPRAVWPDGLTHLENLGADSNGDALLDACSAEDMEALLWAQEMDRLERQGNVRMYCVIGVSALLALLGLQ